MHLYMSKFCVQILGFQILVIIGHGEYLHNVCNLKKTIMLKKF